MGTASGEADGEEAGTSHAAQRRSAILAEAVDLIATRGVDNVRLRDVAAQAGVSIGTLQHYFLTRDQLIDDAFYDYASSVLGQMRRASLTEGDPWRRLVIYLSYYQSIGAFDRRCRIWLEFSASAARNDHSAELIRRIHEDWRTLFRTAVDEGVAEGTFHPVRPVEEIVEDVLALFDGYEVHHAAGILNVSRARPGLAPRIGAVLALLLGLEVPAEA